VHYRGIAKNPFAAFLQALTFNLKRLYFLETEMVPASPLGEDLESHCPRREITSQFEDRDNPLGARYGDGFSIGLGWKGV
jgi:hypothetical protein